ncbi:hypothetical protein OIDMADRAFT_34197 [Oidiodendron maius Zn]|uniref:Uncharacterized protein n=1 Tax=Oidiodendron maius (strain Zn) TaxID=913774 RepID=A0A0C3D0K7_OIDMZ|nr:hypothetical protein OIDMADRAFT_34197 [Oidiodendron maius Zn]
MSGNWNGSGYSGSGSMQNGHQYNNSHGSSSHNGRGDFIINNRDDHWMRETTGRMAVNDYKHSSHVSAIRENNRRAHEARMQQDAINRRIIADERRQQQALNAERRHTAQVINQVMQRERNLEMAMARNSRRH